ncbi:ribonuclease S-F11-like [Solanum tuberosum]|uniref:S protein n=2 Tax=Solanum tuberosum TaxID=4113 RepID=M1CJG3_SOLTU|nr:PREDICTED: ribonuclease S-F11-like [Solanum tuberosum]QYF06677.1 S-RNase 3 [Solanum tuberosum]
MFKSLLTSTLFIVLFSLSSTYADFDKLQLVLTWPPSFCHANSCQRIVPKNFTIHGLWPDKEGPQLLKYCKPKLKYNYFSDKMLNDLDKHWIQLKVDQASALKDQRAWKYQYLKHGSCCQKIYNQNTYFSLALHLKDRFDLLRTLQIHRIVPGSSYTFEEIVDAVKTVTQMDPDIKCTEGAPELYEIGICFTPNGDSLVGCRQSETCDKTGKIFFRP